VRIHSAALQARVFQRLGITDEEAKSRIWGGIHFQFESQASQGACTLVADYVVDNTLRKY